MAEHNELGKWGEDEAARFLQRKGFTILERDWRVGKRDLDIIALKEDGKLLVFVEVKTAGMIYICNQRKPSILPKCVILLLPLMHT